MKQNTDLKQVDPGQRRAITHRDGPMMVLAGPGSGKTFVITHRILHLIREERIDPVSILVITFTKAAALEMEERFLNLAGGECAGVCFGTFHAIFFSILKESCHYNSSDILQEKEKKEYLKSVLGAYPALSEDDAGIGDLLSLISRIKNDGVEPESMASSCGMIDPGDFLEIYREYHRILEEERKLDFDDMVLLCRRLFEERSEILSLWQARYRYLLIDEFQDINPMQYAVVRMLAAKHRNLFIVGDDDQSIYGFRSADPSIMRSFAKDFKGTKQVVLGCNYRSLPEIVKAAGGLIRHNKNRFAKEIRAHRVGKAGVYAASYESREDEAKALCLLLKEASAHLSYSEMAVLFRTRSGGRFFAQALAAEGIPFYLKEDPGSVFSGPIGQDILAIMSFAHGDHSRRNLLRFMNKPMRYIPRGILTAESVELERLEQREGLRPRVVAQLRSLRQHLQRIGELLPFAALLYIRRNMGYEAWAVAEGKKRGQEEEEVLDVLSTICATARETFSYEHWMKEVADYEEKLKDGRSGKERDAVQLMTMHGSKGLEFRMVVLPDVNEGNVPQKKAKKEEEEEEKRRIFYVAMTRAKDKLFLLYRKKNAGLRVQPSRFLKEIGNSIRML